MNSSKCTSCKIFSSSLINENQICFNWSVIKWETFITVKKKIFPLGEKRENTLKTTPKATIAFRAFRFCTRHKRVNNNENQICSKWSVIK